VLLLGGEGETRPKKEKPTLEGECFGEGKNLPDECLYHNVNNI
jgi:hypothetical protein